MIAGLTGSFGSGKTTVTEYLKSRRIPVIDADEIAREVTAPGSPGMEMVLKTFGNDYRRADGGLDRKKLALRVFSNPDDLKRLEEIVHPLVRERELALLEKYKNESLVVLSAPLLLEKGLDRYVDKILVVTISEEVRLRRLMKGHKMTREEITERLKSQMPQEEKARSADFIIDNSGTTKETQKRIDAVLKTLLEKKV